MSCADVCLDMDHDGNDFYWETMRTARKQHVCCECRRAIRPGERYEYAAGKGSGEDRPFSAKTCAECSDIRDALVCGAWVFEMLWDAINESVFPVWQHSGPWDCLAKVETEAARKKLLDAYNDWKADRDDE